LLNLVKKPTDAALIAAITKCQILSRLSQILAENGDATSNTVLSLLTRIVLLTKSLNTEFTDQISDILRSVYAVPKAAEAGLIISSHIARIAPTLLETLGHCGTIPFMEKYLKSEFPVIRGRALNLAGNICRAGALKSDVGDRVFPVLVAAMCDEGEQECQKFAVFAVGNAIFHTPAYCSLVIDKIGVAAKLLDSCDAETVNHTAGVICNLARDEKLVERLVDSRVIEKMIKVMGARDDLGEKLIQRLPVLCKYAEARKILKMKANRAVIVKFTKNTVEESLRTVAKQIIRVLDAE
jgi:fused-like protein